VSDPEDELSVSGHQPVFFCQPGPPRVTDYGLRFSSTVTLTV
jgi:hypothetical protein